MQLEPDGEPESLPDPLPGSAISKPDKYPDPESDSDAAEEPLPPESDPLPEPEGGRGVFSRLTASKPFPLSETRKGAPPLVLLWSSIASSDDDTGPREYNEPFPCAPISSSANTQATE